MLPYVLLAFAFLSALALVSYALDKGRAKRHRRRIPEAFLLGVGFCGGSVGALCGMLLFRHKTRHLYFWIANVAGLAWQVALCLFLW